MHYKTLLSSSQKVILFIAAGASILLSNQVWAYDGTINVTGNIVDGACDVSTDSQNINVNLSNIPVSAFTNVGDVSNPTPFQILLKNCPASVHEADIMFIGKNAPGYKGGILALTQEAGVAEGVGVRIRMPELGDFTNSVTVALNQMLWADKEIEPGDNTLTYTLQYEAVSMPVTAGTGNAVMYFDLYYQ